jgi:sec-independent protein translocase protein TatB
MFDIGWSELLLIGAVALIVIGPKELPGVLRALGQWMAKIRRMAAEFQGQFQEAMREAEMADIKKHVDEISDTARNLTSQFDPLDYMGVKDLDKNPSTGTTPAALPATPASADLAADAATAPSGEPVGAGATSDPALLAAVAAPAAEAAPAAAAAPLPAAVDDLGAADHEAGAHGSGEPGGRPA